MASSGLILAAASFVVELLVFGALALHPNGSVSAMVMVITFPVVPPLLVGCFARKLGFTYGLVLGVMPAILAMSELPTAYFGLSPVAGAAILFFICLFVAGLSGAAGQFVARKRDAA